PAARRRSAPTWRGSASRRSPGSAGSCRRGRRSTMFLSTAWLALFALVLLLAGCGGSRPPPPKNLPVATPSTTVGPGDIFEIFVVGETGLPKEYRVQPDGSIDFPYIDRVNVAGLEPQDIVTLLKAKLVERKILVDPQMTLVVKQYNSKKIVVLGQVAKPRSISWTEGMKLVDAISQTGGLTAIADGNH